MAFVGLDFGTSNSSIAQLRAGKIRLFELDPGAVNPRMLRSFIFVNRAQQHYVGSEAVLEYQRVETGRPVYWESKNMGQIQMVVAGGGSPIIYWDDLMVQVDAAAQGRLIQSIKTGLRTLEYEGTQIFDRFYSVEELIAILLSALKRRSEAALGEEIAGVVIGRPVKFSDQPEVDQRAQRLIASAAKRAGFSNVAFEFEPVAAANVYHHGETARQAVLVFDFGGGTLDMTVMEVGGAAAPTVLATRGVLLGGDDIDRALLQDLKRHFGEGATLRNRRPVPAHIFGLMDSWQTMVLLSRPEYRNILRDAARGDSPEAIKRLIALVNHNLGFSLFQEIEKGKIRLSSKATAYVELNEGDFAFKELITRPQLESRVRKFSQDVRREIGTLVADSGLRVGQIQAVLRTGGTSEVPAFIRLLGEIFGHDRLRPLNPFETIVGGLAYKAGEMG